MKQIIAAQIGRMQRLLFRIPPMITCAEFESFILDYLDDELPRRQRFVFDMHILACRKCREYLVAYQRAVDVARATFADDAESPDLEIPEDLVEAILAARDTKD